MSDKNWRELFLVVAVVLFLAEYVVPWPLLPAGLAAFAFSFLEPLL